MTQPKLGERTASTAEAIYSTELKKIKKDLEAAKRSKQENPSESEPEFKFKGNNKQYKLDQNMLDKIGSAMATRDDEERKNLLSAGKFSSNLSHESQQV